jgi:hypothetical protein
MGSNFAWIALSLGQGMCVKCVLIVGGLQAFGRLSESCYSFGMTGRYRQCRHRGGMNRLWLLNSEEQMAGAG